MRRKRFGPLLLILLVAVGALTATLVTESSPELGLDLQGGASVVLRPPDGTEGDTLDQAIEIIRSRVDALGVAEPEIVRQGDTVLVELPGIKDQARALEIVGQTAELQFRPVLAVLPPEGVELPTTTTSTTVPGETTTTVAGETTTTTVAGETTTTAVAGETTTTGAAGETTTTPVAGETTTTIVAGETTTTTVPAGPTTTTTVPEGVDEPTEGDAAEEVVFPGEETEEGEPPLRYQLGPTEVLGRAVRTASAKLNVVDWYVEVDLTSDGREAFNALAAACNGMLPTCPTAQLAIVLDGVVVSAPRVEAASFPDTISITGQFSERDAKDLALVLRYGSLPVQLEQQDAQTVSASLGKDSLRAGLIAGGVGALLVLLYMVFYYRKLGVVVLAGLAVWGSLQWSIISWLGETQGLALSLAGATGIIVSIGVTVDSYVVFFERLKDEVRAGHTMRSSVDRGFKRAFRTILAADISAFIGAALLYWLTVGPVRGFAFFLGLSTLLDVTVAWFFTRPIVGILARREGSTRTSFIGMRGPA